MAGESETLASTGAQMLDQFSTYSMTGWTPRSGSDDFDTVTLLRRGNLFTLRVTDNRRTVLEEIVLNDVISYVIKVRMLAYVGLCFHFRVLIS